MMAVNGASTLNAAATFLNIRGSPDRDRHIAQSNALGRLKLRRITAASPGPIRILITLLQFSASGESRKSKVEKPTPGAAVSIVKG
jgi:hypothetical protein